MSDTASPKTDEIFDLATGLDTLAVGGAPAESFAMLDAVMTQATGMAMYNAVVAQQRDSTARMAAVTMTCTTLLALPVGALGDAGTHGDAATSPGGAAGQAGPPAAMQNAGEATGPACAASGATHDPAAAADGGHRIVDTQIVDAVTQMQMAVMSPQVMRTAGAGKAFQVVALSAAIAVLDAAEALRGVSAIATAASGAALAKFLATGDRNYLLGATAAQEMVSTATDDFTRIAGAATSAIKAFPSA